MQKHAFIVTLVSGLLSAGCGTGTVFFELSNRQLNTKPDAVATGIATPPPADADLDPCAAYPGNLALACSRCNNLKGKRIDVPTADDTRYLQVIQNLQEARGRRFR